MRTSSDLIVDVRRSLCLTVGMAGVVTGVAIALYLAASNVAGRGAGVIAALAGVALLIACVKRSAHREPCIFTLRGDGSVDWVDRRGVRESGNVVAAGRVGGLWVWRNLLRHLLRPRGASGCFRPMHSKVKPSGFWPCAYRT
jgi:hypothetical protein